MESEEFSSEEQTDEELIELTRTGDMGAYSVLWQRHSPVAIRTARRATSKADPEELVSEAFMKVLKAIKNGSGPSDNFRAYLLTAVRNVAATVGSSADNQIQDQLEDHSHSDALLVDDHQDNIVEKMLTVRAFRTLPTRWQEVLWFRDVEDLSVNQVAKIVGMSPNSVTQLITRAREGMKQAWIQAQLTASNSTPECAWLIVRMAKYSRGKLTSSEKIRADAHLIGCNKCPIIFEEANHINSGLALGLIPLILGGVAIGGKHLSSTAVVGTSATASAALKTGVFSKALSGKEVAISSGVGGAVAAGLIATALFSSAPPSELPKEQQFDAPTTSQSPEPQPTTTPTLPPVEALVDPVPVEEPPAITYTTEIASGGAIPGMRLRITFSDGSSTEVISNQDGTWSTSVEWNSTKPPYSFTAEVMPG